MTRALFAAVALAATALSIPAAPAAAASPPARGTADFDGDGYGDLAIGAPHHASARGAVVVLYGSATGLRTGGAQLWTADTPGVDGGSPGPERFGTAVAAGDFDGDGYDDLAIGAPSEDGEQGAVHILFGSANGLSAARDQRWHPDLYGVPHTRDKWQRFGASLAAGDTNGDGRADLAIGGPGGAGPAGERVPGYVWVLESTPGGLDATRLFGDSYRDPTGEYGSALAMGDFSGDGGADLAIGAPGQPVRRAQRDYAHAGRVSLVDGEVGRGLAADRTVTQDTPNAQGVAEAGDAFGSALAAGDLTGDGRDDLLVGIPGERVGGRIASGAVQVLRGSATGITGHGQLWHQDVAGVPGAAGLGIFGAAVTVGDFDGDGRGDAAIGAPRGSSGSRDGAPFRTGTVTVLRGASAGLTTTGVRVWHQDTPGVPGAGEDDDRFGETLASGDFDRNRRADLAVAAPSEDVGPSLYQGAVTVLYARSGGLGTSGAQQWHQDVSGVPGDGRADDRFGSSLAG